jgi:U3 small nucleolar RNA-associated protein 23
MRGKRSKQYRKLIQQFSIHFGFREPYQVVVDADFVKETTNCKMDLLQYLERTMHGKVKPMITQCSIRHLYKEGGDRSVQAAIEVAKNVCERRRCGHHPESHPEPLSTLECLSSIVDPGKAGINKHKYCVATQEQEVRSAMRRIPGVPLIYVSRSVMILEPMSEATRRVCEGEEKGKLRDGFVRNDRKRKRGDEKEDEKSGSEGESEDEAGAPQDGEKKKKKKKTYGPKQPNPLAVQKKKKKAADEGQQKAPQPKDGKQEKKEGQSSAPTTTEAAAEKGDAENKPKRKRRRKHKAAGDGEGGSGSGEGAGDGNKAGASTGGEAVPAEA